MGQFVTLLVTKEIPEAIPTELIHFFQGDYLVVPLDILFAEALVDYFMQFETLDEVLRDPEDHAEILAVIRLLKVQTFVIKHWSEHGDMPLDVFDFIIRDGKILKETKQLTDGNDAYYTETLLGYFTDESDFDISRYWNYKGCVAMYRRLEG